MHIDSHKRLVRDCTILANDEVAPAQYRMRVEAPEIAKEATAGQFCMLQVTEGYDPFLRRPMSFERILPDGFQILYKIEGEGTALLAKMAPGRQVSVQGPLGNGFPLEGDIPHHIIVAGGIGVAPFPALADALLRICQTPPEVILAARSRHLILCEERFRKMGCNVLIATDDGSAGEQAFACDMLKRLEPGSETRVYACGPMIMMKTTAEVALASGAECFVSLEARMACGDGACLGCVVEAKHETEGRRALRVCVDGPVFDAREIDWDQLDTAYEP